MRLESSACRSDSDVMPISAGAKDRGSVDVGVEFRARKRSVRLNGGLAFGKLL